MTASEVPPGSIAVGVDGSDDADRAVAWGVHQARLEGRTLALVHAADQHVLREPGWYGSEIDMVSLVMAAERSAQRLLDVAARHARDLAGVDVTTVLVHDDARQVLRRASEHAHLLVVGSRGRGPLRSVLGSVSMWTTRHSRCPVIVCRPARGPGAGVQAHVPLPAKRGVVVGADGSRSSRPVLEFAFAQASLRREPLTVMHCFWDARSSIDDIDRAGDLEELRLLLAESVAGLGEQFPDVTVTPRLARGLVDQCLLDRSPDASLLVVGRPRTRGVDRFLHSSCATAVLERSRIAVAVVPELDTEGSHP
jgi:nucleotide-binding universal stress UspA family protein